MDGRMALVDLTPKARAQVESFRSVPHAAEKEWVGCLTEEEQNVFLRIPAKLQANGPASECASTPRKP
jgi:DNA-binding MarR family transcriptional regulator